MTFSLLFVLCAWFGAPVLPRCAGQAKPQHEDTEGEALFKENKGEQAIAPLEREIAAGDNGADKYNYLGLAYYQAGDYKRSIEAFERGMQAEGSAKWALYYNAGNSAFADGNFVAAEGYYSDAYRMNGEFHAALLNRANARLNQDKLVAARDDYALYMERCPDSAQADRIKALLALLDEEIRDLLPQKLEATTAVLPVAVPILGGSEAVEDAVLQTPVPPAPDAQALEKEAAFLPAAAVVPPVPSEAMSQDAAIPPSLRDSGEAASPMPSEAMGADDTAAPASFTPQKQSQTQEVESPVPPPEHPSTGSGTLDTETSRQALKPDDIAAPPPEEKATQQIQSEEMEEDAFLH